MGSLRPLAVVCLVLALLGIFAPSADATHFAYGSYKWVKVPGTPRTFTFTFERAYRRSFFSGVNVGATINVGGTFEMRTNGNSRLDSLSNNVLVLAVYPESDWFTGRNIFNYTFSSDGVYKIYYSLAARLSTLLDGNKDKDVRMTGIIDTSIDRSPETTGFPREFLSRNYPAYFTVPGVSNVGLPLTYSFSTTSLSALTQPIPQSPAMILNSNTGAITWTPTREGLHATQFLIRDGYNTVPLDMIFSVSNVCTDPARCKTNPVFDPAAPQPQTFYRGVQKTVVIKAVDSNPGATVTVETSVFSEGTFQQVTSGSTSTYHFTWAPLIDSVPFTICFKAFNSHNLYSLGNYCVLMDIGQASSIYITGIIRDFTAASAGFNVLDGAVTVSNTLGADLKPVFVSSAITSINKAAFDSWWTTDLALKHELAYSTILSNGTQADGRIFTFLNAEYFPIDGKLRGNDAANSRNNFFTYEIHTYLTYNGGELFQVSSSDDLWIFVNRKLPNGWNLGGTHPSRGFTIDMDAVASQHTPPLTVGSTYQVDIFFAHRSCAATSTCSGGTLAKRTPSFRLELPAAVLCNAIQSGVVEINLPTTATASLDNFRFLGAASRTTAGLELVPGATASTSGAVWYARNGVPVVISVLHGFLCEFTFRAALPSGSSSAEGFAFVLQRAGPEARGAEGGNLGYGTMPNSLAFEFDMFSDTASYSDPNFQHVSIHTRYQLPNSPSEAFSLGRSDNSPPMTMFNGTDHRVRVQYIPANVEENTNSVQLGWLYVYMNDVLAPVAVAQVDGLKLAQIFEGGNAYVGFTASNGDARRASITVSKWKLTIVPTSAATTAVESMSYTVKAGSTGSALVQAKDSCANKVLVGGEASHFDVSTYLTWGQLPSAVPVDIVDNGDGKYLMSFTPTYAGRMSLDIKFDEQGIFSSPVSYVVTAAETAASKSEWYYSPAINPGFSNGPASRTSGLLVLRVAAATGVVTVRQYDFLNNNAAFGNGGVTEFNNFINSMATGDGVAIAVVGNVDMARIRAATLIGTKLGGSLYSSFGAGGSYAIVSRIGATSALKEERNNNLATATLSDVVTIAGKNWTLYAASAGAQLGTYGRVFATPYSGTTTFEVPAGQLAPITVVAYDQFGNLNQDFSDVFVASSSLSTTASAPLEGGFYQFGVNGTRSGSYDVYVRFAGVNIKNSPFKVNVVADIAYAPFCSLSGNLNSVVAGENAQFFLSMKDRFDNIVRSANPRDSVSVSIVSTTDSSVTYPVDAGTWVGETYTWTYSMTLAGTYRIVATVNGIEVPNSQILTVSPSDTDAANCIVHGPGIDPSSSVAAGTPVSFFIQSVDRFGNNRTSQAPGFTVTYTSATAPLDQLLNYDAGGRYVATYRPIRTTHQPSAPSSLSIRVRYNGVDVGRPAQPMTIRVLPGAASVLSTTTAPPASFIAGTTSTLTLVSRDAHSNLRYLGNEPNAYAALLRSITALAGDVSAVIANSTSESYNLVLSGITAQQYQLSVVLTSNGQPITSAGTSTQPTFYPVEILPAATNNAKCVLSGTALHGGMAGTLVSVLVQARDAFENNQLNGKDEFRIKIDGSVVGNGVPVTGAGIQGQFNLSYTVPTDIGDKTTYLIAIERRNAGSSSAWEVVFSNTATIFKNSATSYAGVPNLPNPAISGVPTVFQVYNYASLTSNTTFVTELQDFTVQLTAGEYTYHSSLVNVAPGPASQPYNISVTFTPNRAGLHTVNVVRSGVFRSLRSPQHFVAVPGFVDRFLSSFSGLSTVDPYKAGEVYSIEVTLRDVYRQVITDATKMVKARFYTTTTPSVQIAESSTQTWDNTKQAWILSFTLTDLRSNDIVRVQVQELSESVIVGNEQYLHVVPADVDITTTTLSIASVIQAGANTVATVTPRDRYSNVVVQTSVAFDVTTSCAAAPDGAIPIIGSLDSFSRFVFTPYQAQSCGLSLSLNSVTGPSVSFVVEPALPSTAALDTPASVTANAAMLLTLVVKDAYGNVWPGHRTDIELRSGSVYSLVGADNNDGRYPIVFRAPSSVGSYVFDVTALRQVLTVTAGKTFAVTHGSIDAESTIYEQPDVHRAEEVVSVSFALHDSFGNPVTTDFSSQLSAVFLAGSLNCQTNGTDPDAPFVPQEHLPNFQYNITYSSGNYELHYVGDRAGEYTMFIKVDNVEPSCSKRIIGRCLPGAASGEASIFRFDSIEASPPVLTKRAPADGSLVIVVEVRDRYSNIRDDENGDTVTLSINELPSSNYTVRYNPSHLASLREIETNGMRITSPSRYVFQVSVTHAGDYSFDIRVNDQPIQNRIANTPSPLSGIITAASVYTFQLPVYDEAVAGIPGSFELTAADRFGNPIVQPDVVFTYAVSFRLTLESSQSYIVKPTVTEVQPGKHRVDYLSYWHGQASVTINIQTAAGNLASAPVVPPLTFLPATCARIDPAKPYRCDQTDDRRCVASYAECPDLTICPANQTLCASDNQCHSLCPAPACAAGLKQCPGGFCSHSCHALPSCPSSAPHACVIDGVATGHCRATAADCPSPVVCRPGMLMCADGLTCVYDALDCSTVESVLATNCSDGWSRCASGKCAESLADCSTPVTCGRNQVLCQDGSCQNSSAQCPDAYLCYGATSFRCSDGSCRSKGEDCPSHKTCPEGWVMCSSGSCAKTVARCPAASTCPATLVRCADGTCQASPILCPSVSTCTNSSSVKCSNNECRETLAECPLPVSCPTGYKSCFDSSCVLLSAECPSATTCGSANPVLCQDGSCALSASDCPVVSLCPRELPVKCPSGACRGSLFDCPQLPTCPPSLSVRCPDGRCVVAADQCIDQKELACPAGTSRCPGGFCAAALSLCPSLMTCPYGYMRCVDGTCRDKCPADLAYFTCPPEQVTCPQAGMGTSCAKSLKECPQAVICPIDKPVRCSDTSCVASISNCPPVPSYNTTTKAPCPDGSWADNPASCPTSVTCPDAYPYKCWDETCRQVAQDCPNQPICGPSSPYLCPTGLCVTSGISCTSGGIQCPDQPNNGNIRCPTGECKHELRECPVLYSDTTTEQDLSGASTCNPGYVRCRDGSCKPQSAQCADLACPPHLAFRCSDGLCVRNSSLCNLPNGCPYYAPVRCLFDGSCRASRDECPTSSPNIEPYASCLAHGLTLCADGSCNTQSTCNLQNGCPRNRPFRCNDLSCVAAPISDNNNLCVVGASTSSSIGNACPANRPFRCPDGFCSISAVMCPPSPAFSCPPDRPVNCASGACNMALESCPLVYPCLQGEERCGDGSCRAQTENPLTTNCPAYSSCPVELPVRCDNGLCAVSKTMCLNETTGCPSNWTMCDNGVCVIEKDSCAALRSSNNGCPIDRPFKCSNGACVLSRAYCPLSNGCPRERPVRCAIDQSCQEDVDACVGRTTCEDQGWTKCADSSCAPNATSCFALNGCPVLKPIRCGQGDCARVHSECPLTVACDAGMLLCYDGKCVADKSLCARTLPCEVGLVLCPDNTCKANYTACGGCPMGSPVLCPTGECRSNINSCPSPITVPPGSVGTPPADGFVQCFDGSYKRSFAACQRWAADIHSVSSSNDVINGVCPSSETLCPNGACAKKNEDCEVVAACPASHAWRCWNGECTSSKDECPAEQACPAARDRCEDGTCRSKCLQFDGCPLSNPYHCPNRECAASPDECEAATIFDPSLALKRRLQSTDQQVEACYENCHSQIKAANFQFTVPSSTSTNLVLATDSNYIVQARLTVPAGAFDTLSALYVRSVGDSRMRNNVNKVTVSRRSDVDGQTYLTYPKTLLSVAFECAVDENVVQPFRVPLTVTAHIDMDADPIYQDVCLATIYSLEDMDFHAWSCVDKTEAARRANPVRSAATNLTETEGIVKGVIHSCGQGQIYGFVYAPLRRETSTVSDPDRFFADNLIYIVLGVVGFAGLAALVIYMINRLHRYRSKYHDERKAVEAMQEEVDNMEQFGGAAGRKDEELEMQANPLVIQMRDMQAALDARNNEIKIEEARMREEESAARQEAITALQTDKDRLARELEKLKAELALVDSAAQQSQQHQHTVDMDLNVGLGSPSGAAPSHFTSSPTIVPAAFTASAPARKKKNID